jgi:hypothetical protein
MAKFIEHLPKTVYGTKDPYLVSTAGVYAAALTETRKDGHNGFE